MASIETIIEKEALILLLRSKTALGRLIDTEVHGVLTLLESIGFRHQDPSAASDIAPVLDAAALAAGAHCAGAVVAPPPVMEAPPAPAQ